MQSYDCVGVLGGGSWGTTLAHLLGENGHKALLWLRDPKIMEEINRERRNSKYLGDHALSAGITALGDLAEIARRCEIIVLAIPGNGFREVVYSLGHHLGGNQILISACKGLEAGTHSRMTQVIREECCVKKVGVLSGPNLSEEIMRRNPSATVLASNYHEVIEKGLKIFSSKIFKVYGSEDVMGAELGGVIKNVIAIAAGIVDGLEFGANTKAFLMTRGIHEMGKVGQLMGADPITFTGLSGIGDLIVTCSSKLSRNYRVGYYLSQGQRLDQILQEMKMVAEGVNTCKVLCEFSREAGVELPITEGVYKILYENRGIPEVIEELMARKSYLELDATLVHHGTR